VNLAHARKAAGLTDRPADRLEVRAAWVQKIEATVARVRR
jgi:hypothetical protein